ncbi:MAG: discoidin domain-containing protein [Candidatus Aminicenantes bacterium]|nr:discoidin domain-containing protein [Candidatus Aminicenantes bacterium]
MIRGRFGHLPALAAFALLSAAMTWPLVLHLSDRVPSDPYDPLHLVWLLDRNARSAEGGFKDFGRGNIFTPHSDTAYYGDVIPALSLLSWPVGRLAGNFVTAYNVLHILSFFLCAWGMYALACRLARSKPAAFLAGLIFAFCAYRFGHLAHLEILHFAWIPFCFLFLHRFFESLSLRDLIPAALFFLLQVLSCAYYGPFAALFFALFFLFFAFQKRLWAEPRFWLKILPILAATAAVLVWYFLPYVRVHKAMFFSRPLWEVEAFSAQLQHFLSVPRESALWGRLLGSLGGPETCLYPGLAAVGLTLAWWFGRSRPRPEPPAYRVKGRKFFLVWDVINGAWFAFVLAVVVSGGFQFAVAGVKVSARHVEKPFLAFLVSLALRFLLDRRKRERGRRAFEARNPEEWFYLLLLLAAGLLSLGPTVRVAGRALFPGPYGLLYKWVPGFSSLRAPARFAALVMLALALFSALALARLLGRLRSPAARAAAVSGLSLLVLAEAFMLPLPLAPVRTGEDIPEVYAAVRALPADAVLVEAPMPESDAEEYREALPMYYSAFHRKRIVNGYSGYSPPGYRIVREAMEGFPSPEVFGLLRDLEVTHVLVRTEGYRREKGQEAVKSLGGFSSEVEIVFQDGSGTLLRILPGVGREGGRPPPVSRDRRPSWRGSSNRNPEQVPLAFDGRADTIWTTGYPQHPGDHFILDLGGERELEGLEMDFGVAPYDYPRGFVLEGSLDGRSWRTLAEKPVYWPAISRRTVEVFSSYRAAAVFERTRIRYFRVILTRPSPRHWSISEIRALD